jgi:hypothetical protein
MYFKNAWKMVVIILLSLVVFISVAQAQQPYDITECHSGTVKILHSSEESTIFSAEGWGFIMSNHENKVFDNFTLHIFGIGQVMPGKTIENGYIKFMDPDGDIMMSEFSRVGPERVTKTLYGTGKWKDITGGGKSHRHIVYGRIPPNAAAACSRSTGTFELPK